MTLTRALTGIRVADEEPFLDGFDTPIAAVDRELDAPVVSTDGDVTYPATKAALEVEEQW